MLRQQPDHAISEYLRCTGMRPKEDADVYGVARQNTGTAGRAENVQVGVFLAYTRAWSPALIDGALYPPEKWTGDRAQCRRAGIGDEVAFTTKPGLAGG